MSFAQMQQTILAHLDAQWREGGELVTPIALDNAFFDPAADAPGGQWIRASFKPLREERKALTGDPASGQERLGQLHVQIFVRPDTGTQAARELGDRLRAIFREASLPGGIEFFDPIEMGWSQDESWYQDTLGFPCEQNDL